VRFALVKEGVQVVTQVSDMLAIARSAQRGIEAHLLTIFRQGLHPAMEGDIQRESSGSRAMLEHIVVSVALYSKGSPERKQQPTSPARAPSTPLSHEQKFLHKNAFLGRWCTCRGRGAEAKPNTKSGCCWGDEYETTTAFI